MISEDDLGRKADVSDGRPLELEHLAAAVVGDQEALLVGTVHITATKVQHLLITWRRQNV